MQSVYEQLQEVFYRSEPELYLWEFSVPPGAGYGTASFRMLSSGFDIGLMRCLGARVLCLTTLGLEFNGVEFYKGREIPDFLSPLTKELAQDEMVLVFRLADGGHAEHSNLPAWERQPVAYIVCESVEFQTRTGRFE